MTFSIGDVLEQLSDDFPDITVSKIRFLESQGLIAPMRTASGFRMFSDTDITKLKWILLHQRDRFLPLKVIKEYLSSISDDAFANGNMPAFDFETSGTLQLEGNEPTIDLSAARDRSHLSSVPQSDDELASVASISQLHSENAAISAHDDATKASSTRTSLLQEAPPRARATDSRTSRRLARVAPAPSAYDSVLSHLDIDALGGSTDSMTPKKTKASKRLSKSDVVVPLETMTIETGISGPVLKDLVKYGVLEATGSGNSIVFPRDEIALALTVAPLLERGIEVRHIKNYTLFAAREVGFLEHVVQDDLRKRNPEAREIAQEKAKQFIQDTARLKEALLLRALKKETQSQH